MIIETPMSKYSCASAERRPDGVHLLREDGSTIVVIADPAGIKSVEGGEITIAKELQAGLEIEALKAKLITTDYQAIKILERIIDILVANGMLTAEEYEPIKVQRQAWRDRINELEELT